MKTFYLLFGVLILFVSGCSSQSELIRKYKTVYEPVKKDSITSYYVGGLPFGAYANETYSLIYTVQPAKIAGTDYLSFWLLYKNSAEEEYLIEPTKIVKMSLWKGNVKKYEIAPESPISILKDVEDTKQSDLVIASIRGALQTLNSTTESGVEKQVNKLERNVKNINFWYEVYSESVNNDILRRNTIFTNKSVNGLIYFASPWGPYYADDNNFAKYEIKISLDLPGGMKELMFKPVAGE
jgi:hypothetical protein